MTITRGNEPTTTTDDTGRVGFKSHLRPETVPGQAVYLVSQRGLTTLRGVPAEVLAPLLDGTRTTDAVLREAAPALAAEDALCSLRALDSAGLLRVRPACRSARRTPQRPEDRTRHRTGKDTEGPAAEAFWDLLGLDGGQVPAALARARVRVLALNDTDPDEARTALAGAGLHPVTDPGAPADLSVVLCDDYLSPRLADVDAAHRREGTPWLPVRLGWSNPWFGPVFRPDDGPCWHCLASRLRGHRTSEEVLRHALGRPDPVPLPPATLPVVRRLALNLAALEAAKWLGGLRGPEQSTVRTLDTVTMATGAHPVPRIPQCPSCGDGGLVARRVRAPFRPVSRPKAAGTGNGHRALTPEQMLERHRDLVDPVTGVVKELRRAPGSPDFLQAFLSGPNLAMPGRSLAGLRAGLRSLSGGKGLTETEARVSALCEAVERYSGTRHGDEPVVRGSLRGLAPAALHPNAVQLYGEEQFRERERWNARGSRFQYVPPPLDPDRPTDWTPVWSLTGGVHRLLPTSMLYFAAEAAPDGLWADSNGNAAGSSPEDALVQGFLELVERDAVALWWYNRSRRPGVDLTAFDADYLPELLDGYRGLNRSLWVLDLTSDFGIPVMAALSRRTDKPAEDVVFGFGAHFDPRLALRRALTELGQLLPAVGAVTAGGTGYRVDDPEALEWWRTATLARCAYLTPDPAAAPRCPGDWAYTPTGDLLDDVTAITGLVRERGMELLVLDQTRADLGIPVVKVIVPGMRQFWARFAPGRLFDVPVALGLRNSPLPREQLNPVPLFV
ncbi:TOMM precursor leader peptide-binding protein [Streptomyces sp. 1331.2]|uniref:TOMM precursor leader peptide-binding protein n=1 Tax=Streptomyces sp. 1331.2 TaxID=1938835 RepID=UPI000BD44DEF|nr:TOMM precursor leader peptide-binding protein [Streptomyces sp. 1331.2]SOB81268.1 ribosomal protein S12 methylthiotransferase accessory factor [Streptomyces sp. 1331.2]